MYENLYNKERIMQTLGRLVDNWIATETEAIKKGCGMRGCDGMMTTDTDRLLNQLLYSIDLYTKNTTIK